jgi:hypothetical protein
MRRNGGDAARAGVGGVIGSAGEPRWLSRTLDDPGRPAGTEALVHRRLAIGPHRKQTDFIETAGEPR